MNPTMEMTKTRSEKFEGQSTGDVDLKKLAKGDRSRFSAGSKATKLVENNRRQLKRRKQLVTIVR